MALIKLNNKSYTSGSSFLPTGSVLQVVSGINSSQVDVSTVSVETNILEKSITPSSTSSKILVLCSMTGINTENANRLETRVRWSTSSGGTSGTEFLSGYSANNGNAVSDICSWSGSSLISPSTTSTVYVKANIYTHDTNTTRHVNVYGSDTTLTLFEIVG